MKFKIGDNVLVKATVESVEITSQGIYYNLRAVDKKTARFYEDYIILDESSPECPGDHDRAEA